MFSKGIYARRFPESSPRVFAGPTFLDAPVNPALEYPQPRARHDGIIAFT